MIKKSNIKFIDLELPSGNLWADRNLGAISTTDIGKFYKWGYIIGYKINQIDKFFGKNYIYPKVFKDPATILGENIKTPEKKDFDELFIYTTKQYTKKKHTLISSINKRKIEFQTTGYFIKNNYYSGYYADDNGSCYWTSTKNENDIMKSGVIEKAFYARLRYDCNDCNSALTCSTSIFNAGLPIRPIKNDDKEE